MKDDKMSTSDLHRTSSVQQSQQLAELREKCRSLEDKCAALQRDKETTKTSLDEAMKRAEREMLERKELEKSLVQSYSEVKVSNWFTG
jgi:chromosome segregation ATPase